MKGSVVRISTVSVIAALVVAAAWYGTFPADRKQPRSAESPASAVAIQTGTPVRKDFRVIEPWLGTVQSKQVARIVSLEEGEIVSIDAEDEARLEKGAVLFTLGGPRLHTRVAAAKEEVSSLRQRLVLEQHLVERKKTIVKQLIGKQVELELAKAQVLSLETQLETATAALEMLQDATRIAAPFSGVFTNRIVSVGQDVSQGETLGELVDRAHLRVVATLFPLGNAPLQGRPATVRTASGDSLAGTVIRVLPQRTAVGGTVVWLEGAAFNQHLRPGERVAGEVLLATHKAALAVPEKAIVLDEHEKSYVFVRRGAGYARQEVQPGVVADGWVEIISGIQEADTIVVLGAYELYYRDFSHLYKVAD